MGLRAETPPRYGGDEDSTTVYNINYLLYHYYTFTLDFYSDLGVSAPRTYVSATAAEAIDDVSRVRSFRMLLTTSHHVRPR